jgi:TolB-like protein
MGFFTELKRRNVFRVAIAYVVAAWVLLQVADLVLENIEAPGWIIQVMMLFIVLGFVAAVAVAWAYELTPEGIRRESEVTADASITAQTGRKLDRITIAFLAVAVLILMADRFMASQPWSGSGEAVRVSVQAEESADVAPVDAPVGRSIAVLPFVNMSADPDNEYFSDGISEELLNVLARIPELKVAARTSAFAYKGSNVNISEIARDLKVANILEGSVRKSGNQVRITAQLIKADDGYHLWSDTFDRELTNIFAIQDEIATAIADALKVTLDIETGDAGNLTGTTSTAAYDAYLRGMNQWHLRTGASLENAAALFEEAIAIDPQFAKAHAGLALTYAVIMDYTEAPEDEARARARQAAQQALSIDPKSIEAATALIYSTGKMDEQLAYAEQAIALNPSFATTHQWYGTTLALTGDLEASEQAYLRAFELDPRSRIINANLAGLYLSMNRFGEAEKVLVNLLSWAPGWRFALEPLFVVKVARGDLDGAAQTGRQLVDTLARTEDKVDVYLDLFGEMSARQAAIAEILAWPVMNYLDPANPRVLSDVWLFSLLALSGDYEHAELLLERSMESDPVYIYGYHRVDRSIPGFVCRPETQALFAGADLPPLRVPYPCDELLK